MPVIIVPGNADRCPECGAIVANADKELHARWHTIQNKMVR